MLILTATDVDELLPMDECIEAVEAALRALARGAGQQPLRKGLKLPGGGGILGVMPAQLDEPPVAGVKVLTVFPNNHRDGLPSHQGTVQLFELEHGRPIAVLDAASITAVRTAAASAVATRALARADAGDLAILGSGAQAHSHLEAMMAVRELRRVRVWSRNPLSAERFAKEAELRVKVPVEPMATAEKAVDGADLICTVTAATEPVLEGAWLAPGAHVNAVGACVPSARELDGTAMARARVFTDRRESAEHEAGDLILARREGLIGDGHLRGELGDVLLGTLEGRTSDDDVTVYESLGIGIFDLAAGWHVYQRARERGRGVEVEL